MNQVPHVTVQLVFPPISRRLSTRATNHKATGETANGTKERLHVAEAEEWAGSACGRAPIPGQFGRGEDKSQFTVKFVKLLKCPLDQLHLLLTFSFHLHHKRLNTQSNSEVRAAGVTAIQTPQAVGAGRAAGLTCALLADVRMCLQM